MVVTVKLNTRHYQIDIARVQLVPVPNRVNKKSQKLKGIEKKVQFFSES